MFYVSIGHQSIKKLKVDMEGQEADPNIPSGLVKIGAINLP